jgi:hypothetical protein
MKELFAVIVGIVISLLILAGLAVGGNAYGDWWCGQYAQVHSPTVVKYIPYNGCFAKLPDGGWTHVVTINGN